MLPDAICNLSPAPFTNRSHRGRQALALLLACIPCLLTAQTTIAADSKAPTADEVMLVAHNSRAVWNHFPGFTADITVTTDRVTHTGTISVSNDFKWELELEDEDAPHQPWLNEKLQSVISHRRASEMSDAGFSFVTGPQPEQGYLIANNNGSGTFFIRDGLIREVHRKSKTNWFEITNLEQSKTADGRYLPQTTSFVYRDPSSGNLLKQRSNTFSWTRVGSFDLPSASTTVESGLEGFRSVRELTFTNHRLVPASAPATTHTVLHRPLPEALTSFSAAVVGEYLYVFSGHSDDTHGTGRDLLVDHFRRIKFDDPAAQWEELAKQPPAQSTALVSDGTYLYRIAGLSFLNSGDEPTNFNSTDHFARYDIQKNEWTQLAPLPEPRSSLDAAVVGRSIFVAGGWNLQGESSRDVPWRDTVLRFDLDRPEAGWQTIDGPGYVTRALSVAAHHGKLYLLGGIQERGFSRKVSILDPETGIWSEGPELKQDSSTAGFATSAFATGGQLYYTGSSGIVYRLNADGSDWEVANRLLIPRMFTRLLPINDERLIVLGGTGSGIGSTTIVESFSVAPTAPTEEKLVSWSVPFEGRARHSQFVALAGGKLYTFGGNASPNPHDFSEAAFVNESFVFDIARQKAERLPDLPRAMQSGAALRFSQTSEHQAIFVMGGIGFADGQFRSLDDVYRFDPESKTWHQPPVRFPSPRSMFTATSYDDALWMFGGSVVGKEGGYVDSVLHWWGDDSAIAPLSQIITPTVRRSFGGAVLQNEYYLVGGLTNDSEIAAKVDVFNFTERTWREVASPQVPRVFPSLVATEDKLYLFGGFTRADGHFAPANSLEVYNREQNVWRTLAEEIPGVNQSMTMLEINGRLLFYGIDQNTAGRANFVLYDPEPFAAPNVVSAMSFGRPTGPGNDSARNAKLMMHKDVDKDGKLSRSELGQRMQAFFDKADTDQNGFVSLPEAIAALDAEAAASEKQPE